MMSQTDLDEEHRIDAHRNEDCTNVKPLLRPFKTSWEFEILHVNGARYHLSWCKISGFYDVLNGRSKGLTMVQYSFR